MEKTLTSLREPVSGFTHLAGIVLSAIGLWLLISSSILQTDSSIYITANLLYGISLIAMYSASTFYHLLPVKPKTILLLKKIDHMTIFFLIAGTYTPFCLISLKNPLGLKMFAAIWSVAILGVFLKIFWIHAPRWFYVSVYLFMGWMGAIIFQPLAQELSGNGIIWLIAGGLFYSVGAIIYGTKRPDPFPHIFGFHEIWHLFVMAGSFCHFWCIYRYV